MYISRFLFFCLSDTIEWVKRAVTSPHSLVTQQIFAVKFSLSLSLAKFRRPRDEDLISTIKRASTKPVFYSTRWLHSLVNLAAKQIRHSILAAAIGKKISQASGFSCNRITRGWALYMRTFFSDRFRRWISRFCVTEIYAARSSTTWHNLAVESSHVRDIGLLAFTFSRREQRRWRS